MDAKQAREGAPLPALPSPRGIQVLLDKGDEQGRHRVHVVVARAQHHKVVSQHPTHGRVHRLKTAGVADGRAEVSGARATVVDTGRESERVREHVA